MADIHNYKKRLDRTMERVRISDVISQHNKDLIMKYHRTCLIEGLSVAQTVKGEEDKEKAFSIFKEVDKFIREFAEKYFKPRE